VLFLEEKSYIIKALFQKSKYTPRGHLFPGYDITPVNNIPNNTVTIKDVR
jgi:hypothetical protein